MKQIATIAALLLLTLGAMAKPVDPAVALRVAGRVLGKAAVEVTPQGVADYRLYHGADGSGFVLLSADDCAVPLLAYSPDGSFPADPASMPPHVAAWLDGYRSQLALAREQQQDASAAWQALLLGTAPKSGEAVVPLLTTTWGQGAYYNALCPAGTSAGCVAVALAQLMRYWQHPVQGRGSHAYYSYAAHDTLRADFSQANYQWSLMPDALNAASSTEQVAAVARLIADLGIALSMQYRSGSSIAYISSFASLDSASAESVLREHFNFSPSLYCAFKDNHSNASWRALATAELVARRPIIYSGHNSAGGGHAFVVDGCDEYQLFHVNWGWDGTYNGYYNIDSLLIQAPSGASVSYHLSNEMIVGIHPIHPSAATYTLQGASADPAAGTVSGTATLPSDSLRATLLATATEGYVLDRWSSGAINNPRLYSPTADLSDTAHFRPLGGDTVAYCRDFGYDWYGTPSSGSLTWGIRLPGSLIPRHRKLHQVQFVTVDPGTYHLRVYTGQQPSMVLVAEDYEFTTAGWQTVTIEAPLPVYDTAPLWITLSATGMQCATQRSLYTGNPDGAWLLDGDTWRPSHEVDGTYGTWMIRAIMAESDKVRLSLRSNYDSWGITEGSGMYYPGDTVTATAVKTHPRYDFDSWSDGCTDNPYSFVIEADMSLTAYFSENTGIDDPAGDGLALALHGLSLAVDNPLRRLLVLYDIAGRQLTAPSDAASLAFDLPSPGIYILRADGMSARRIVAVKQ